MISGNSLGSRSAADLRREFDNSFASPSRGPGDERVYLLNINVAGEEFAVRTGHITGLAKRRRVTPVPSLVPGLLGITTIRGTLVPTYDLAGLLALPLVAGVEGSWLMLTNRETPVAFVFDDFEGHVEIAQACLYESDSSDSKDYLRHVAKIDATNRAVIDLPGLVKEIQKRAGLIQPKEE